MNLRRPRLRRRAKSLFQQAQPVTGEQLDTALQALLAANPDPKVFISKRHESGVWQGHRHARSSAAARHPEYPSRLGREARAVTQRRRAICAVVAVLCHCALLFGFRLGSRPAPLSISDEPVEVQPRRRRARPSRAHSREASCHASTAATCSRNQFPNRRRRGVQPHASQRNHESLSVTPPPTPPEAAAPAAAAWQRRCCDEARPAVANVRRVRTENSTAHPSFNPKPPYSAESTPPASRKAACSPGDGERGGPRRNVSIASQFESRGTRRIGGHNRAALPGRLIPRASPGVAIASRSRVPVAFTLSG